MSTIQYCNALVKFGMNGWRNSGSGQINANGSGANALDFRRILLYEQGTAFDCLKLSKCYF